MRPRAADSKARVRRLRSLVIASAQSGCALSHFVVATWVGGLRERMAALVPVHPAEIEQPYEGTVLIEVTLDQTRHEVAIDYFDRARLLDEVAGRWPRALTTSATSVPTSWPATTSTDASRS